MTDDPNRKTLRQFQCRDYLWDVFEVMSRELQCSVDYLINESMRHYARAQGRLRPTTGPAARTGGPPGMQSGAPPMNPMRAPTGVAPGMMGMPRPPGPPGMNPRPVAAGAASYAPPTARAPGVPPVMPGGQPTGSAGPPRMPGAPPFPANGAVVPGSVLYAIFEGQKYPIAKDEFFIGRSNKSCDLVVKDPNVSRQHARVVRHNNQFWMVDMGSTNGIEFQGTRVDRRPIGEGDVFKICDHEIVFTYR